MVGLVTLSKRTDGVAGTDAGLRNRRIGRDVSRSLRAGLVRAHLVVDHVGAGHQAECQQEVRRGARHCDQHALPAGMVVQVARIVEISSPGISPANLDVAAQGKRVDAVFRCRCARSPRGACRSRWRRPPRARRTTWPGQSVPVRGSVPSGRVQEAVERSLSWKGRSSSWLPSGYSPAGGWVANTLNCGRRTLNDTCCKIIPVYARTAFVACCAIRWCAHSWLLYLQPAHPQ